MLSAANIYFTYFVDTGYFAEESSTKPLLHIWSLGVEEKFYLSWPFLGFTLLHRNPSRRVAIALAFIASLILGLCMIRIG